MRGVRIIAEYTLSYKSMQWMKLPGAGVVLILFGDDIHLKTRRGLHNALVQRLDNIHESLFMNTMADDSKLGVQQLCLEGIAASCVERFYLFCVRAAMTGLHALNGRI